MDEARLKKLNDLKEMGEIPYKERFERSHNLQEAKALEMDTPVSVAGRVVLLRNMGKLAFVHLQDQYGKLQIALQKDVIGEEKFAFFAKFIDLGDFIGVRGKMFTTHKGEISVLVDDLELLSKTMRPLPEKFHGVTDRETCYRQRYLDTIANRETMDRFLFRGKTMSLIRQFLEKHNFVEVETPILSTIPSGAAAKPFFTHHNALDLDVSLRIAPENYLKRCIAGGFDRVYEFAKCFRNEGMDPSHLQEFTMLEYYGSYWNFEDNMQFTEKMFEYLLMELFGTLKIEIYGKEVDFTTPWPRIDYREMIIKDCGIDFNEHESAESLRQAIRDKGIDVEDMDNLGFGNLVDALYKKVSRPKLIQPCFVIKHPIHTKPLARKNDEDGKLADTFQLLVNTWEIINAYSELVDPIDQRERFEVQANAKAGGDEEAMEYDEDYVLAMEHGMPPISGWGMGIDRLVCLLTSQENLRDTVLFPLMKPIGGQKKEEKKIPQNSEKQEITNRSEEKILPGELPDETQKRFIAVINKKTDLGKAMNALGHMSAGLAGGYNMQNEMCFLEYEDKDSGVHPHISHYPFIVLRADNSNKIRKVREEAKNRGIPFTDFTETMTLGGSQAQQDATKNTAEEELEYLGICMFGDTDMLKEFTSKFSLFK